MDTLEVIRLFLLVATAIGLMMSAGLAKHALEPRRLRRTCPSCGRLLRDCSCRG